MNLLIEAQYLPNIAYFKMIAQAKTVTLEACENYQKQSFRNRTLIKTANKVEILSIPVLNGNSKLFMRDVQIDYSQHWVKVHLRGIQSAYGNSPFFEHYFPPIEQVILQQPKYLFDLNLMLIEMILKLLKMKIDILLSDDYYTTETGGYTDLREIIHPKKSLKVNLFTENISFNTYCQVFGNTFVENLSIIDLLMNEGSAAKQYLY